MRIAQHNIKEDAEILQWLKGLPRYRNTPLKSLWSRFRFFLSVLSCRMLKQSKPLFIVLVTNNRCNLSCKYCYGQYGDRAHYNDFTTGELVGLIDRLWDMGTRNFTVHGGESLLRKDIGEILNYMKLKGFYVSLNTNGTLIPHKINEVRCVDTVCISLDGTEEAHDKNRGAGSYRQALAAIDIIRANNIPLVVHATLTRHNVHDLKFLAEKGSELGFRLQFSILYNTGSLEGTEVLTDPEIRAAVAEILELKRQGAPVYYSESVLTSVLAWPFPIDRQSIITADEWNKGVSFEQKIDCYHGALKYQIDADGRVITCWGHDDAAAPNVKEVGIEEAIRQCTKAKNCSCCTFLANNEHNLMFGINLRTIMDLVILQMDDALKIRRKRN
ncbi:MAG: radical SAM protein [Nitrospirae bacterium]|nr:MAG: radical SAM protein [Nitrospirota bacterium]